MVARRRARLALRLLISDAMDREICADHYRDAPQEHDLDHRLVAASLRSRRAQHRAASGGEPSSISISNNNP
jgi:hypothetical protein